MKTALIILNYNNRRDTRNCVESVLKYNTAPIRIIVVDNASKPEEKYYPSDTDLSHGVDISVLELTTNEGYGRGNNAGLGLAYADPKVDRVMILNNDILFTSDIIPTLIQRSQQLPNCAIISPALMKADNTTFDLNCARTDETPAEMIKQNILHYWWKLLKKDKFKLFPNRYLLLTTSERDIPIELPSGSCMLVNKDLFRKIGSFDPHTFLYYEENILFRKIQALGLQNYLCRDLSCIHLGASTIANLPNGKAMMNHSLNSGIHYLKEYRKASPLTQQLYFLSGKLLISMVSLQKKLKRLTKS